MVSITEADAADLLAILVRIEDRFLTAPLSLSVTLLRHLKTVLGAPPVAPPAPPPTPSPYPVNPFGGWGGPGAPVAPPAPPPAPAPPPGPVPVPLPGGPPYDLVLSSSSVGSGVGLRLFIPGTMVDVRGFDENDVGAKVLAGGGVYRVDFAYTLGHAKIVLGTILTAFPGTFWPAGTWISTPP